MKNYKNLYKWTLHQFNQVMEKLNSGQLNPLNVLGFDDKAYTNMLIAKDRVQCANRLVWDKLEMNLTSQELETMFYDFGSLILFENARGEAQFSRFTKIGELNPYGKLSKIQPIDFAGKAYDVVRSVISPNDTRPLQAGEPFAVVINDYTTYSFLENELCRAVLNATTTIKDQVAVLSQLHNNVILSIKKAIALCDNEDQRNVVLKHVADMLDPSCPITVLVANDKNKGKAMEGEVQFANFNNTFDTQNYCQTIDYYDKIRRGFNGIPSPDTFEKKERKITAESENSMAHIKLVLFDALKQRQNALDLFNKYTMNRHKMTVKINEEMFDNDKDEAQPNLNERQVRTIGAR